MIKSLNIVWAAGSEGYHLDRALKKFSEPEVLAALAQQMLAAGAAPTYMDAMRCAIEVVGLHLHVQLGATVCKNAHEQLQANAVVAEQFSVAPV